MFRHLKIAFKMAFATLVLLGIVYPFAVTGIAQVLFPNQANGSLIRDPSGRVVGSTLIAQKFERAEYFYPRPSAVDYDAANSGGSNLGPTSRELRDRVAADIDRLPVPDPEGELRYVMDAVRLIRRELRGRVPLIPGGGFHAGFDCGDAPIRQRQPNPLRPAVG